MTTIVEQERNIEREFDRLEIRLAELYSPFERAVWWSSPQPLLNNERALDVLTSGKSHELHRILDQLDAGVYL